MDGDSHPSSDGSTSSRGAFSRPPLDVIEGGSGSWDPDDGSIRSQRRNSFDEREQQPSRNVNLPRRPSLLSVNTDPGNIGPWSTVSLSTGGSFENSRSATPQLPPPFPPELRRGRTKGRNHRRQRSNSAPSLSRTLMHPDLQSSYNQNRSVRVFHSNSNNDKSTKEPEFLTGDTPDYPHEIPDIFRSSIEPATDKNVIPTRERSTSAHSDGSDGVEGYLQNWQDAKHIPSEDTAIAPARARSTSGHSDGHDGIKGFMKNLQEAKDLSSDDEDVKYPPPGETGPARVRSTSVHSQGHDGIDGFMSKWEEAKDPLPEMAVETSGLAAFPPRRRSISTHSDAPDGMKGFLKNLEDAENDSANSEDNGSVISVEGTSKIMELSDSSRSMASSVLSLNDDQERDSISGLLYDLSGITGHPPPFHQLNGSSHLEGGDHLAGLNFGSGVAGMPPQNNDAINEREMPRRRSEKKRPKRVVVRESPVPPPPKSELTPKESLVERERQARAETERARLKRQLALSREQEAEDDYFSGGNDFNGFVGGGTDGNGRVRDGSTMTENESIGAVAKAASVAGTLGDNSSLAARDALLEAKPPAVVSAVVGEGDQPLGYAMERFLSDGAVINRNRVDNGGDASSPQDECAEHKEVDVEGGGIESSTVTVENNVSHAHVGIMLGITNNQMSVGLTGGDELPMGSSQSSSLLSDLMARDDAIDGLNGETHSVVDVSELADGVAAVGVAAGIGVTGDEAASVTSAGMTRNTTPIRQDQSSPMSVRLYSPDSGSSMRLVVEDHERVINNIASPSVALDSVPVTSAVDLNNSLPSYSSASRDGVGGADISGFEDVLHPRSTALSTPGSSVAGELDDNDIRSVSFSNDRHSVLSQPSSSGAPPRMMRLTEVEILEMNEIDYASIGNAPAQSIRDERLASFSDSLPMEAYAQAPSLLGHSFSERTHTTDQESVSVTSGGQSIGLMHLTGQIQSSSTDDVLVRGSGTDALFLGITRAAESASVTAAPSETAPENSPTRLGIDDDEDSHDGLSTGRSMSRSLQEHDNLSRSHGLIVDQNDTRRDSFASRESSGSNGLVNRVMRPGMLHMPREENGLRTRSQPAQRMPVHASSPLVVDDFDFDKYDPSHLHSNEHAHLTDSLSELPVDVLSPSSGMTLSPMNLRSPHAHPPAIPNLVSNHGASNTGIFRDAYASRNEGMGPSAFRNRDPGHSRVSPSHFVANHDEESGMLNSRSYGHHVSYGAAHSHDAVNAAEGEARPLVAIPQEVMLSTPSIWQNRSAIESVFSNVRSKDTATLEAETNDAEKYRISGIFARAFPERFAALIATLVIEIPVLLMISGGSDRLCGLIGRKRYQLMMAFLPLSSAISGNCGLQASTLTTRAVSHDHVTKESFMAWLKTEVLAACLLGMGMGLSIGLIAFQASGYDFPFTFAIFIANFVSVVTAGVTGTLAPLIFTFIFRQDSGKWGGPLETAIQDIVGSFAMVVLSYRILLLFGPHEVDPSDVCGSA